MIHRQNFLNNAESVAEARRCPYRNLAMSVVVSAIYDYTKAVRFLTQTKIDSRRWRKMTEEAIMDRDAACLFLTGQTDIGQFWLHAAGIPVFTQDSLTKLEQEKERM